MAHQEQFEYIHQLRRRYPAQFQQQPVLEVGSLDINGSVRQFFDQCRYTGIDVAPGPGVDLVSEGQLLTAPDATFGTVISAECFEHNPHWQATFRNMHRMCRPGGLVIMTCATTGRAEHGTARTSPTDSPLTLQLGWDYYQNLTEQDFRLAFDLDVMFDHYEFEVNQTHHDLYFHGRKRTV